MNLSISIPNPCTSISSEDWKRMDRVEQGRFCSKCEKMVVDFSIMTDSEVIAWFEKHRQEAQSGQACINIDKGQFDYPLYVAPSNSLKREKRWMSSLSLTLFLIFLSFKQLHAADNHLSIKASMEQVYYKDTVPVKSSHEKDTLCQYKELGSFTKVPKERGTGSFVVVDRDWNKIERKIRRNTVKVRGARWIKIKFRDIARYNIWVDRAHTIKGVEEEIDEKLIIRRKRKVIVDLRKFSREDYFFVCMEPKE